MERTTITKHESLPGTPVVTSQDCLRFEECSAPICPMDEQSLKYGLWYPDEEFCIRQEYGKLLYVRNQRKIAKRARNKDFYFTYRILNHNCQIKRGIKGLDPDQDNCQRMADETNWLMNHPVKRQLSEAEKEVLRRRAKQYLAH